MNDRPYPYPIPKKFPNQKQPLFIKSKVDKILEPLTSHAGRNSADKTVPHRAPIHENSLHSTIRLPTTSMVEELPGSLKGRYRPIRRDLTEFCADESSLILVNFNLCPHKNYVAALGGIPCPDPECPGATEGHSTQYMGWTDALQVSP